MNTTGHPGGDTRRGPRVLVVGEVHSSHAQSWLAGLISESVDVRAFSMTRHRVPADLPVVTYVPYVRTDDQHQGLGRPSAVVQRVADVVRQSINLASSPSNPASIVASLEDAFASRTLAHLEQVLRQWKPNIVHILGLWTATRPVRDVIDRCASQPSIVLQLRGGSDLALRHADPVARPEIVATTQWADVVLSDNPVNYKLLAAIGVNVQPPRGLERVPGTGGIDLQSPAFQGLTQTSKRRDVVFPKAYESAWSKGLPLLEALKLAWPSIQPCTIRMVMAVNELQAWTPLLPKGLSEAIEWHGRVPQQTVMSMMRDARVVAAPSLVDGTPNSMWEAMACGAIPIVSPLETITPFVTGEENVLMARNLYPDEIAEALVLAMNDDVLVDEMAAANTQVVHRLANRAVFMPRVADLYRSLVAA